MEMDTFSLPDEEQMGIPTTPQLPTEVFGRISCEYFSEINTQFSTKT